MSNLLHPTTNPDHPTLGMHFWSFVQVSLHSRGSREPSISPTSLCDISQLNFDTVGIAKLLSNVKVAGPYQIPCWVLKNTAQEIAHSCNGFFHFHCKLGTSLRTGKTRTHMLSSKRRHIICLAIQTHLPHFCFL